MNFFGGWIINDENFSLGAFHINTDFKLAFFSFVWSISNLQYLYPLLTGEYEYWYGYSDSLDWYWILERYLCNTAKTNYRYMIGYNTDMEIQIQTMYWTYDIWIQIRCLTTIKTWEENWMWRTYRYRSDSRQITYELSF